MLIRVRLVTSDADRPASLSSLLVYHSAPGRDLREAALGVRDHGHVNRLGAATSPYLLQHKDNPVGWWEWGPEAFEEARRRNVPVLLSVGYAACHWCHEVVA